MSFKKTTLLTPQFGRKKVAMICYASEHEKKDTMEPTPWNTPSKHEICANGRENCLPGDTCFEGCQTVKQEKLCQFQPLFLHQTRHMSMKRG
jgi:hypothetical protein